MSIKKVTYNKDLALNIFITNFPAHIQKNRRFNSLLNVE